MLISGAPGYTFENGAALTFVGAGLDMQPGNAVIVNNALLQFAGNSTAGNATIINNGTLSFFQNSDGGNARLENNSGGTVDVSASAGPLGNSQLAVGSIEGAGNYVLGARQLTVGSNNLSTEVSGVISGTGGSLVKIGTGTLTLSGANTYTGDTTIDQGTLQLGSGGTPGSIIGAVTNNASLQFHSTSSAGNATITTNGTTAFFDNSTGGNAQFITNHGGVVDFSASAGPLGNNQIAAGSLAGAGVYNLGSRELIVGSNNLSTEVSGIIVGTGGSLFKIGTGTLTLSGNNTYTGGTTIGGGMLQLGTAGAAGAIVGAVTNNASFDVVRSDFAAITSVTNTGTLRFLGTTTAGNARLINTSGSVDFSLSTGPSGDRRHSAGSIEGAGSYVLGGSQLSVGGNGLSTEVSGVISGAGGSLVKTGAGTLTLSGTNTYTGGTTINGGTLQLGTAGSAGTILGAVTNNHDMTVVNSSFAGVTNVVNNGFLLFSNSSGAGTATIANNPSGAVSFAHDSSAGSASITNHGFLRFFDTSTAGNATITTTNTTAFFGNSNGSNARFITNLGGVVDFSASAGPLGNNQLAAGSIAGAGNYALGARQLTVGSDDLSTEVSGVTAGAAGSLVKTGTGTLTLSGNNTYTGATVVDGGTLSVNGAITASSGVTVNALGTLGGPGQVRTALINAGGTLAPGQSVGTMTVNGNLVFNAGSFYAVEVSPTAADRTNVVGGTATLAGGVVQAVALPGSFQSRTYTILSADGGLLGAFAGLNVNGFGAARNPRLAYDTNNVSLVLDPGTIVLALGAHRNHVSVASGINRAVANGATPPDAFDSLLNVEGAQFTHALNQVSGQTAAGGAASGTQMTNAFLTLLLDPNSGAVGGTTFGGARSFAAEPAVSAEMAAAYAAVAPKDKRSLASAAPHWSVWGQAYGGYRKTEGDTADASARTWGLATGFDYRPAPELTLGFALAAGNTSWDLSHGLGGGRSEVFQIGIYGSRTFGQAYVSAALSYAWHGTSTERIVTVAGTDKLAADFDAHSFGGRVEAGYRLALPSFGVSPYAALQVQSFRTPSYGERATAGASTFALAYESRATATTRVELGAWFDNVIMLDRGNVLALRSRAGWAHDRASNPTLSAVFQALPGSQFTVNGAQAAPDSLLTSLGAEMRLPNRWSVGAKFDGEFARRSQTYAGTGTVRYVW